MCCVGGVGEFFFLGRDKHQWRRRVEFRRKVRRRNGRKVLRKGRCVLFFFLPPSCVFGGGSLCFVLENIFLVFGGGRGKTVRAEGNTFGMHF